jgi:3',5'-cyclic AMP phosphodiesterase CpdA
VFPRRALALLALAVAATVLVAWLLGSIRPSAPTSSAVDASPTASLADLASPPASDGSSSARPSGGAGASSAPPSGNPATGPAPSAPVLIGTGDIARCDTNGDEQTARLVARSEGIVFTLGDNAYDSGSPAEFRDCYDPTWGRVKDRTELPVAGNHDYGTRNAAGYRDYFGKRATPDGETWYSRDIGDWHVVVLDANCPEIQGGCGPGSPQLQWLRQDLRQSDARCTLAMWHQPRFSSGEHGNDPSVAPFWNVLYDAGADLILNGHDHDYERFAPQDPDGNRDRDRGLVEIVVGTGGGEMRDLGPSVAANSIVRQGRLLGVIQVTLHPGGWSWQFLSTDGSFTDSGEDRCH